MVPDSASRKGSRVAVVYPEVMWEGGFITFVTVLLAMQALCAVVSLSSTAYLIKHYNTGDYNASTGAIRWAEYFIPLSAVWYTAMASVWIVSIGLSASIICFRTRLSIVPNIVVLTLGMILNMLVIGVSLGYILDMGENIRTNSKGKITIIYNTGLLVIVLAVMVISAISLCFVKPDPPVVKQRIQVMDIIPEAPEVPIQVEKPPDIGPEERSQQLNRFYESEIINNV
ncbi:unnamed protein product [Bursaphelenchus xylophilus]|uniref:(pine wood nematode) hypothetical protein n=1 Tax=Bursaphelenchus xylophilus TaxID=6326 RepID=A0A1I7RH99_BURXY|nr:unnamed protein product [Bursaphelenchus xylophilus]CAG9115906.1 unnamed protein product [Bursaphelenchus xylophilus]